MKNHFLAAGRRLFPVVFLFCSGFSAWGQSESPAAAKSVIVLQPLGAMREKDIAAAKEGILALYDIEVKVAEPIPLPAMAWYEPRSRYRADKLLTFLETAVKMDCKKVVGLTARDVSTTNGDIPDWGVFGLGSLDGKTCVISTFRLGAGKADQAKIRERLVKVVNHEIGHTFGLDHCPAPACVMQDARGTIKTVDKETEDFCADCRAKLGKALRTTGTAEP